MNESEISLDRSNLMVKSSTKSVEDAHRAVSEAISKHGASSQEAKSAEDALSIAEDRLTLANERAQQAQENVNKSIMSAALQIIPTSITMVDSLSRAWKNFPDMTGVLTTLGTNISMVGNKALIASVSVAGFVGGFVLGYEAITQFGDALRSCRKGFDGYCSSNYCGCCCGLDAYGRFNAWYCYSCSSGFRYCGWRYGCKYRQLRQRTGARC